MFVSAYGHKAPGRLDLTEFKTLVRESVRFQLNLPMDPPDSDQVEVR